MDKILEFKAIGTAEIDGRQEFDVQYNLKTNYFRIKEREQTYSDNWSYINSSEYSALLHDNIRVKVRKLTSKKLTRFELIRKQL